MYQNRLTRTVLLRATLEVSEVDFPTSFIILKQKIRQDEDSTSNGNCQQIFDTAMDWAVRTSRIIDKELSMTASRIIDEESSTTSSIDDIFKLIGGKLGNLLLWSKKDTMWLYVVDEASYEPLIDGESPIEIKRPSELVPKLLPIMQLTMHAAAIYGQVSGFVRLFGYPLPSLPSHLISQGKDFVKLLQSSSTVEQYAPLKEALLANQRNGSSRLSPKTVRGYPKDELKEFYKANKLLTSQGKLVRNAFGKLEKHITIHGKVIWTARKDILERDGLALPKPDAS